MEPIRPAVGARPSARVLILAALVMLAVTTVLGAIDGAGGTGSRRGLRLSHVHAGGLGWAALAILGLASLMFDGGRSPGPGLDRLLAAGLVVFTALFVLASWAGTPAALAVTGGLDLVLLATFAGRVAVQRRGVAGWSTPQLGLMAGLVALVAGSAVGALAAAFDWANRTGVADRLAGAHPPVLLVPFLFLSSTALLEHGLGPDRPGRADVLGRIQVGLIALGGVAILAGALADNLPLLVMNVPLHLAGLVVFLLRQGPRVVRPGWRRDPRRRWFVPAAVFLAVDLGLVANLVLGVAGGRYLYPELVPDWLVFAVDHVTFIGVLTNVVFGLLAGTAFARSPRWVEWAVLWSLNAGIVAATIAIALAEPAVERVVFPIWGVSLLGGTGAACISLWSQPLSPPAP